LLTLPDAEALAALPLRVPLALCRALDAVGVTCSIKWPNDLVVEGRKLGGVLIESLAGPKAVIVGYGINGTQGRAELPLPEATSLRLAAGAAMDLSRLAVDLATALLDRLGERVSMARVVDSYRERSVHRSGDRLSVRLADESVSGRFAGFDQHGRLRLDTSDGVRVLSSVEILSEEKAGDGATR
jgi:BirA family biotin operon repressor/biotin-[acetyl-CoA-carboxylase] ligase